MNPSNEIRRKKHLIGNVCMFTDKLINQSIKQVEKYIYEITKSSLLILLVINTSYIYQ